METYSNEQIKFDLEDFISVFTKFAELNPQPLVLTKLKTLYNLGMPENNKVVRDVVNWKDIQFTIIPDIFSGYDKIYLLPHEITPIKMSYDYEMYDFAEFNDVTWRWIWK